MQAMDTIFVYNGTYREQIVVYKSLIIEGESNINTIVEGGFKITEEIRILTLPKAINGIQTEGV